jgi:hypothetical protein
VRLRCTFNHFIVHSFNHSFNADVFDALLRERRVILTAASPTTLSACAHALLSLLRPLQWPHIFVPLLPAALVSMVCAPMPFLVGVPSGQ